MNINENLLKSIEDSMNYEGIKLEIANNFDSKYFELKKEMEQDNVSVSTNRMDSHMFLYVFANMLRNNAITITFNENATEEDIRYLDKLSKSL